MPFSCFFLLREYAAIIAVIENILCIGAQGSQQDKMWLLKKADTLLEGIAQGKAPRRCRAGADAQSALGGMIYELISQLT